MPDTKVDFWKAKIDENIARDKNSCAKLANLGWHVITVWSCETTSAVKIADLAYRLAKELGKNFAK